MLLWLLRLLRRHGGRGVCRLDDGLLIRGSRLWGCRWRRLNRCRCWCRCRSCDRGVYQVTEFSDPLVPFVLA